MKAAERLLRIQELFSSQEFVDVETLCRLLEASESTVRRDLSGLEKNGFLRRVHGGALSLQQSRDDLLDFQRQSVRCQEEKRRIGKMAAALVEDEQTLILDGGSTVAEVARNLLGRRLHIVTNSLPIAEIFSDSRTVELTLTGGFLYPRLGVLLGPFCEQMLGSVSADLLIMGIGGITESGLSNNNSLIVSSECRMITASRKVIIVADHTKFGRKALVHLAALEEADTIVTDSGVPPEFQELVRSKGIELVVS
ncbi:MAG: DeoR/GlpR family DNA-binding transcription regulator [Acidobacteriota bacterium]